MFMTKKQGFLQAVVTLGAGRGIQMALGFVHLMVVINVFGGSALADTYFLAMGLFALTTGVVVQCLTFTFVPVFNDIRAKKGEQPAWDLASAVYTLSIILLAVISGLTFLLAPQIARIIGPGLSGEPGHRELLTALIRILSPAVVLAALSGIPRALFSSYQIFFIPVIAGLFLEIGLVVGTLVGASRFGPRATMVGGVVGAALQTTLLLTIFFIKRGAYRPRLVPTQGGLGTFGTLLLIRLVGIAVSQINLLVDRGIVTLVPGEGNVTALVTSFKIANFVPQILIWGVCEAVVAVFSNASARGEFDRMRNLFEKSLKTLGFLIVPGAAFLIACRYPVIAVLFEHGEFTAADTAHAALPLLFYTFNLPFALVNFFLIAVLWSMKDHRSVLTVALLGLVINITGDVVFMSLIGYSGIALANLPRGVILFVVMTAIFRKRIAGLHMRRLARTGIGFLFAGLCAFGGAAGLMHFLGNGEGFWQHVLRIILCAAVTGLVYVVLCRMTAPREFSGAVDMVRRRIDGRRDEPPEGKTPWNGDTIS
jgi:putative peptidoglycan lipid II flippase